MPPAPRLVPDVVLEGSPRSSSETAVAVSSSDDESEVLLSLPVESKCQADFGGEGVGFGG